MPWKMLPVFSFYAQKAKARFFLPYLKTTDAMLDVGSGDGWWTRELVTKGFDRCVSIDLDREATIRGDIRSWESLGIAPASFDVIFGFEIIEHVDCIPAMHALLKPGGLLMLTTPVPAADKFLKMLEILGLNQPRGTPHVFLQHIRGIPGCKTLAYRRVCGLSQWGVFRKVSS